MKKLLVSLLSSFLLLVALQSASASAAAEKTAPLSPINLNTADAKMLVHSIKGIGIKRAESIVKYRETHGSFKTVKELASVPLIGKNFVSKNLEAMEHRFVLK